ncbi:hypothetical protein [Ancylobacter vacuolatus]|uniref:Uncharacterized protein n=1 Tax=Ancylobacter vacuolatus TaxID=223389 RepID=A0ABU0DNH9_9HYPH|nr:hypothetical protein [Ancylobacter vacuolatus]MDQ0350016.1 hypothetical protein [Ancylobacter vacuolatus]
MERADPIQELVGKKNDICAGQQAGALLPCGVAMIAAEGGMRDDEGKRQVHQRDAGAFRQRNQRLDGAQAPGHHAHAIALARR